MTLHNETMTKNILQLIGHKLKKQGLEFSITRYFEHYMKVYRMGLAENVDKDTITNCTNTQHNSGSEVT